MKKINIKIGRLFQLLDIDNQKYEQLQNTPQNIYIKTPTNELTPIIGFVKKQNNNVYKYKLENDTEIKCSDKHLVTCNDNITKIGEATEILTINGYYNILEKKFLGIKDVYDVCLPPPHLYVTPNGIIHHNSTLSKIVVNDILGCQYIYINASDETGIDTIRGRVTNFIQTKSIDGNKKVVILDEFEGMSKDAQKALRNLIEEYKLYARFILTSNYVHLVIEPILSRCAGGTFYLQPSREDYLERCKMILKCEKIVVEKEQIQNLKQMINDCYPDLRSVINQMQKFSITGKFIYSTLDITKEVEELAKLCFESIRDKKDIFDMRGAVIAKEKAFNGDYQMLLKKLFELFYSSELDISKKKVILLVIADAMCSDASVLDKEINFFACVIKIEQILDK